MGVRKEGRRCAQRAQEHRAAHAVAEDVSAAGRALERLEEAQHELRIVGAPQVGLPQTIPARFLPQRTTRNNRKPETINL